jgi:hypothetical protein
MTIGDLESAVQSALEALRSLQVSAEVQPAKSLLLPEGLSPVVEFLSGGPGDADPKAAADEWNPLTGRILITFRPTASVNGGNGTSDVERGAPTPNAPARFHPVPIRGEPASATLLADRGSL